MCITTAKDRIMRRRTSATSEQKSEGEQRAAAGG